MRILRVLLSLLEMAEKLPPSSSSSSSLKKADQRQEHFFVSPKRYEVMKLVNHFVEMLSLQQILFSHGHALAPAGCVLLAKISKATRTLVIFIKIRDLFIYLYFSIETVSGPTLVTLLSEQDNLCYSATLLLDKSEEAPLVD